MFCVNLKNIIHKQTKNNCHLLYFPCNDILDDILTNLDMWFFTYQKNTINKDNIYTIYNTTSFSYDLILTYQIDEKKLSLANRLHLPIVNYLRYGTYNINELPDIPNIYYVCETYDDVSTDRILGLKPTIQTHTTTINDRNNVLFFINNEINYGNSIPLLSQSIQNLSLIEDNKITEDSLDNMLSSSKICIDLYNKSIYKMLYCIKHNIPYITLPSQMGQYYKSLYSGVILVENLQDIIKIVQDYTYNDTKLISSVPNTQRNTQSDLLNSFVVKIKRSGMIL